MGSQVHPLARMVIAAGVDVYVKRHTVADGERTGTCTSLRARIVDSR